MNARARHVYLSPGEYFVGGAEHEVHTVLGSCVSITLWHRARRVGAMSHFMLARRPAARPLEAGRALDGRYGPESFTLMLRDLAALGIAGADCEAKLFGGGSMFAGTAPDASSSVGRSNGEAALALLHELAIPVVSYSLFGEGHRKIIFEISSGDVWAQREARESDVMSLDVEVGTGSKALLRDPRTPGPSTRAAPLSPQPWKANLS